jgi:hypothetical protein
VWSQGGEWNGDWSDASNLWNTHPNIKAELKSITKNDGMFWYLFFFLLKRMNHIIHA